MNTRRKKKRYSEIPTKWVYLENHEENHGKRPLVVIICMKSSNCHWYIPHFQTLEASNSCSFLNLERQIPAALW